MATRRIYKYRGRTLDELKKLSMDDLIKLLPSRARRSLSRGMSRNQIKLYEKIQKRGDSTRPVKTHIRDFIVLPHMVGSLVHIHNGKEFIKVKVQPEMIGHYLGEFGPTQKTVHHSAPGVGATRSSQFVPLK